MSDLSPHPKNNYYFDDVSGDKWNEFLESIRKNGVREQIIVTDDMVIVSGHQRVRACKELGIQVIDAKIEHYNSDDDVIRDLIEINTKQRGVISDSEIKIGRRIKFLEEYYGIKNGNNQHTERVGHNVQGKTQDDLAEELEMSKRQMSRYKSLTDLIPELQDAVESGQITATTAMGFVKKLSPEEQKKLAEAIGGKEKVSSKEVEKYIIELKAKDAEIEKLSRDRDSAEKAARSFAKQINQGGRVIEKTVEVEVVPSDYKEVKNKAKAYDAETKRKNATSLRKKSDNSENRPPRSRATETWLPEQSTSSHSAEVSSEMSAVMSGLQIRLQTFRQGSLRDTSKQLWRSEIGQTC